MATITAAQVSEVDAGSSDFAAQAVKQLEANGIVRVAGIRSVEHFIELGESIGDIDKGHPANDAQGVMRIFPREDTPAGTYSRSGLIPHTDSAGQLRPPAMIFLYCQEQASSGGESLLVDGRAVFQHLVADGKSEAIKALSTPQSCVWGMDDKLPSSVFERTRDRVRIRYRYDECGWFAAPAVQALPDLISSMKDNQVRFRLEPGEGYIIQNARWLHGRESFEGNRELCRMQVNVSGRFAAGFSDGFVVDSD